MSARSEVNFAINTALCANGAAHLLSALPASVNHWHAAVEYQGESSQQELQTPRVPGWGERDAATGMTAW